MRELGIQPLPSSVRRSINIRLAPVSGERCHEDDAQAEHIWHGNDMIKVKPEDRLQSSTDKISPITNPKESFAEAVARTILLHPDMKWHKTHVTLFPNVMGYIRKLLIDDGIKCHEGYLRWLEYRP